MKTVACFVVVLALLAVIDVGFAQDQSSPQNAVKLFKEYADNGLITNMLTLYTDPDVNGPLQWSNYPRLVDPMQTYSSGWAGQPFVFTKEVVNNESSVVVYINSPSTKEQIKFYVHSFDGEWYIDDIEIYELESD